MEMAGKRWEFPKNGQNLTKIVGNFWKWREIADLSGKGMKQREMARRALKCWNDCKWLKIDVIR